MANEKTRICPYCDAELEIKNNLLYCPRQEIFIGEPDGFEDRHPTQGSQKEVSYSSEVAREQIPLKESRPKAAVHLAKAPAKREVVPTSSGQRPTSSSRQPRGEQSNSVSKTAPPDRGQDSKSTPNDSMVSLSGIPRRYFAFLIDLIILSPAFFVVSTMFPSGFSFNWEYSTDVGVPVTSLSVYDPVNILFLLAIPIVYFILFEGLLGASIGKFILKERIVVHSGRKAPIWRVFVKALLLPFDMWLGTLYLLFSRKNQTLGDKVAGTLVVKKNLMGPPLEGAPTAFFRKLLAVVMIFATIFFGYVIGSTIPKVKEINEE